MPSFLGLQLTYPMLEEVRVEILVKPVQEFHIWLVPVYLKNRDTLQNESSEGNATTTHVEVALSQKTHPFFLPAKLAQSLFKITST